MLILHIAEKPSVAKSLAMALSENRGYQTANGGSRYNKLYIVENSQLLPAFISGPVTHRITSVSGHTHETDFEEIYRRWTPDTIESLFEAPLVRYPTKEAIGQVNFIKREARASSYVALWLDPDREGEFISFSLLEEIGRGQFVPLRCLANSLTPQALLNAWLSPQNPQSRINLYHAARLRNNLDLRLGAIFSRWQTLSIKERYSVEQVLSFGPCQIPTLSLVVDAYNAHINFKAEPWFKLLIHLITPSGPLKNIDLQVFFSRTYAQLELFQLPGEAQIGEPTRNQRTMNPPSPMNTIDLQKAMSKTYSASMTAKAAERLYLKGLMSYPRTETQNYSQEEADETFAALLAAPGQLGGYANSLLTDPLNLRRAPIPGRGNDNAHSALRVLAPAPHLTDPIEKAVYNYVARHNLMEMSQAAIVEDSVVNCRCGKYPFILKGLRIILKNWLELSSESVQEKILPNIPSGIAPLSGAEVSQGFTQAPKFLTERDLIELMDSKGIGTDSTISTHIETILNRKYAEKKNGFITPTNLGLVLITAYFNIGTFGDKLIRPEIRAKFEAKLKEIERGNLRSEDVEREVLQEYHEIFTRLQNLATKMQFLSYFRNLR